MQVKIDPDIAELIQQRVETGRYSDAAAVMREALYLLEERDGLDYVRNALDAARAQHERGEYVEWTPSLLDRLEESSEDRYLRGEQPHPDVCG